MNSTGNIYYVEEILRMLAELWELLEVLEPIENLKGVLCQTSTCCNIDTQLDLLYIHFRFTNSMNTTGTIVMIHDTRSADQSCDGSGDLLSVFPRFVYVCLHMFGHLTFLGNCI